MAFLRILAGIVLLIAVIVLISDITRVSTGGSVALTSTLSYWKSAAPQSLTAVSGFVQRNLHSALWDGFLVRILLLPAWSLLGALGVILALIGRKKRRVNIYSN